MPKTAPHRASQVHLYGKHVFLIADCDLVVPTWLSFLTGVDLDDVSSQLNLVRHQLGQNKMLRVLRLRLVQRTLDMLCTLAERKTDYLKLYKSISLKLKEGIYSSCSATPPRTLPAGS